MRLVRIAPQILNFQPPPATPPSRLQLPPGPWATVLECLCARFPRISRQTWEQRFAQGLVQDASGAALPADVPFRAGLEVRYFRQVEAEEPIPFEAAVIHVDEHLVVADKPHFLPVTPSGGHVRETLLARLAARLGNPDLVPLHRIDRETAGLVMFSACRATRARYHALFQQRLVDKRYEAIAPPLEDLPMPHRRCSRLVPGEPFFRMREAPGEPNSETRLWVLCGSGRRWRYGLQPVTGRKHQLRVHMSALGAPIENDRLYPDLAGPSDDGYARPLQLLARTLAFVDPVSGRERRFDSALSLDAVPG